MTMKLDYPHAATLLRISESCQDLFDGSMECDLADSRQESECINSLIESGLLRFMCLASNGAGTEHVGGIVLVTPAGLAEVARIKQESRDALTKKIESLLSPKKGEQC